VKSKQIWVLGGCAAEEEGGADEEEEEEESRRKRGSAGVAAELAELGVAEAEEEGKMPPTPPAVVDVGPPPAKAPRPAERGLPAW
jgi:hypothetical protein